MYARAKILWLILLFVPGGAFVSRAADSVPMEARVVQISKGGKVEVSQDGKKWRVLRAGAMVGKGERIKTAAGAFVDLWLDAENPVHPEFYTPQWAINSSLDSRRQLARLNENSELGIRNLASWQSRKDKSDEVQLDLKAGTITLSITGFQDTSQFEISFNCGVAGIRNAEPAGEIFVTAAADGILGVKKGTMIVGVMTRAGVTQEVTAGHTVDCRATVIRDMTATERARPLVLPEIPIMSETHADRPPGRRGFIGRDF